MWEFKLIIHSHSGWIYLKLTQITHVHIRLCPHLLCYVHLPQNWTSLRNSLCYFNMKIYDIPSIGHEHFKNYENFDFLLPIITSHTWEWGKYILFMTEMTVVVVSC